jgi:hypothetical protein
MGQEKTRGSCEPPPASRLFNYTFTLNQLFSVYALQTSEEISPSQGLQELNFV